MLQDEHHHHHHEEAATTPPISVEEQHSMSDMALSTPPPSGRNNTREGRGRRGRGAKVEGSTDAWLPQLAPHTTTTTQATSSRSRGADGNSPDEEGGDDEGGDDYIGLEVLTLFLKLGAKEEDDRQLSVFDSTPPTKKATRGGQRLSPPTTAAASHLYISTDTLLSQPSCMRLGTDRATIEQILLKNRILLKSGRQQQQDEDQEESPPRPTHSPSHLEEEDIGAEDCPSPPATTQTPPQTAMTTTTNTLVGLEEFATLYNDIEAATLVARDRLHEIQERLRLKQDARTELIVNGSDRANRPKALEYVYGNTPAPPRTLRGRSPLRRGVASTSPRRSRAATHEDYSTSSALAPVPPPTAPAGYRPASGRVGGSHHRARASGDGSDVLLDHHHHRGDRRSQHLPDIARGMLWVADEDAVVMGDVGEVHNHGDGGESSPGDPDELAPATPMHPLPRTSPQRGSAPPSSSGRLGGDATTTGKPPPLHKNRDARSPNQTNTPAVKHIVALSALQQLESLVSERRRAANPPPPTPESTKRGKGKKGKSRSSSSRAAKNRRAAAQKVSPAAVVVSDEDPDALNPTFYDWVDTELTSPRAQPAPQHDQSPTSPPQPSHPHPQQQQQPRHYVYRQDRVRREDVRMLYEEALSSQDDPNMYLPTLDEGLVIQHLNPYLSAAATKRRCRRQDGGGGDGSDSDLSDVERKENALEQLDTLSRFSSHHHTFAVVNVISAFIQGRLSERACVLRRVVREVLQPVCRGYLRSRKSLAEFRNYRGDAIRAVGGAAVDAPAFAKQHRSPYAQEALLGVAQVRFASQPPPTSPNTTTTSSPPQQQLVHFVCIPTLLGYEYTFQPADQLNGGPSPPPGRNASTTPHQPPTTRPQQYLQPRPPPTLRDIVQGGSSVVATKTNTNRNTTSPSRASPRPSAIADRYHKHQSQTYNRYTPISIAGQARRRDVTAKAKEEAAVRIYRFMKLAVAKWKLSRKRKQVQRCERHRIRYESVLVLQSFARGRVGVDHSTERFNEIVRHESALTIQRVVRGRVGGLIGTKRRQAIHEAMLLRERDEERDAASSVIGAFWRRCLAGFQLRLLQSDVAAERTRREKEEQDTFVRTYMRLFTTVAKQVHLRRKRQRAIKADVDQRVTEERTYIAATDIQRMARQRAGWLSRSSHAKQLSSHLSTQIEEERLNEKALTIQEAARYTLSTTLVLSLRTQREASAAGTLQRFYRYNQMGIRLRESRLSMGEGSASSVRCPQRDVSLSALQIRVEEERRAGALEEIANHCRASLSGGEVARRQVRLVVERAIEDALIVSSSSSCTVIVTPTSTDDLGSRAIDTETIAKPEHEPVAEAAEPEPVVEAAEHEPVAAAEPEPVVEAAEPEPVVEAAEPEPVVEAAEPESVAEAAEPEPVAEAAEPESVAETHESLVETTVHKAVEGAMALRESEYEL